MIKLGEYNKLTILRDTDPGLYLGDDEENVVFDKVQYVFVIDFLFLKYSNGDK